MNTTIFSDEFYTKNFIQSGGKVRLNDLGTLEIAPQESSWNRFKRMMSFTQDPDLKIVHNHLQDLIEEVSNKSGPLFSSLVNEVHDRGPKGYEYLEANLKGLREKLNKAGYLNIFSDLILKIFNIFRSIIGQPSIELKTYSTITYVKEDFFWMANYSYLRCLSKITTPSFYMDLSNVREEGLKLTQDDKDSLLFEAQTLNANTQEELNKLEKGLIDRWLIEQTHKNFHTPQVGTKQILINLEITYDTVSEKFKAAIRNPRGIKDIPDVVENYLNHVPIKDKTTRYFIHYEDNGEKLVHELIWTITSKDLPTQRMDGSLPFELEPDQTYTFVDESNMILERIRLKRK